MKLKIETLLKRRNALYEKLRRSKFNYGGNIAVPNSLRTQWENWKFKIAHYDFQIQEAFKDTDIAKEYAKAREQYQPLNTSSI